MVCDPFASFVYLLLFRPPRVPEEFVYADSNARFDLTVKFSTEQLPAILNGLETKNGDNKLVLEVAVCPSLICLSHPAMR